MMRLLTTGLPRGLLLALLLSVLAVRVVVPQGYMWASAADGSPRIILCSGFNATSGLTQIAATALAAQHDSDRRDHDGKSVDHPCAFAAANTAVDLASDAHPVAPQRLPSAAPVVLYRFLRPGIGLAAPPPPKTGPPAFV